MEAPDNWTLEMWIVGYRVINIKYLLIAKESGQEISREWGVSILEMKTKN